MSRIYFDPKRPTPTPMEVSSRLWCGAGIGVLIGIVVAFSFFPWSPAWTFPVVVVSAVACAVLAVPYGEGFWYWIRYVVWFLRY